MIFKKSAVVVFAYKKYFTLNKVLLAVNQYKPKCLYIVVDFPSDDESRQMVYNVERLISTYKFNFKIFNIRPLEHKGVVNIFEYALNIIFEIENKLIILEDDTIPSQAFFYYCEQQLILHQNNSKIGSILGSNLGVMNDELCHCKIPIGLPFWGWATWADRWNAMPKDFLFWDKFILTKYYEKLSLTELNTLLVAFNRNRQIAKSWDLKWSMYQISAGLSCIVPGINMISNQGYSKQATFTKISNSKFNNIIAINLKIKWHHFRKYDSKLLEIYQRKLIMFVKEFSRRSLK